MVYLVVVAVASFILYLNQVGIPESLKDRLLVTLRERGVEMQFERIRFRATRGIVAERVTLGRRGDLGGEQFRAEEVQLGLDWWKVLTLQPEVTGLRIRQGAVSIPLVESNRVVTRFELDGVGALIRLEGPERWVVEDLQARTGVGSLRASGVLENPSLLRARSVTAGSGGSQAWRSTLLRVQRTLEEFGFRTPAELGLRFRSDLSRPAESSAELTLGAGEVTWKGRSFGRLTLEARASPRVGHPGQLALNARWQVDGVVAVEGTLGSLRGSIDVVQPVDAVLPDRADWRLELEALQTPRFRLAGATLEGVSGRVASNAVPFQPWDPRQPGRIEAQPAPRFESTVRLAVRGVSASDPDVRLDEASVGIVVDHGVPGWHRARLDLRGPGVLTPWLEAGPVELRLTASPRRIADVAEAPQVPGVATDPSFWRWIRPFLVDGDLQASAVRHPRLVLDRVHTRLRVESPGVRLDDVRIELLGGTVTGQVECGIDSRRLSVRATSSAHPTGVIPVLTPAGQRWLGQFSWPTNEAPRIQAELGLVLPPWTGPKPDWRGTVLPTVTIAGSATGGPFRFRGISGSSAEGRFTYTNRVWRIPSMTVVRPEGRVSFEYEGHEVTQDYRFRIDSGIDPMVVKPLIPEPKAQRVFDDLNFGQPPRVTGEIRGRWFSPELTTVQVAVAATNVTYRGEHVDSAQARLGYGGGFLSVGDARVRDGLQWVTVDGFAYDAAAGLISFTNAVSTFAPWRVTRSIGPFVHKTMSPYDFVEPPLVHVNGVIGVRGDSSRNDIRFDAESAGTFRWWKLQAKGIQASVLSIGSRLYVTNIDAGFHSGRLRGGLEFELGRDEDNRLKIDTELQDVELGALVADLSERTNRLEGRLSGRFRVDDGLTSDPATWKGGGRAVLRNGFLWGFPVFGVFSSILDGMSPGLGQARFTEGTANFTVADGLVRTRDLQMKSPSMSLGYSGSVTFDRRIDMVVQGSMFRRVPVLGPVASIALSPLEKLFEYRLGGTLEEPVTGPAHVPTLLLFPFRPFGTLKDLLPEERRPNPPTVPAPVPTTPSAPSPKPSVPPQPRP